MPAEGRSTSILRWLVVAVVAAVSGGAVAQQGPTLPPAQFMTLPEGTKVRYDDRNMVVREAGGFRNVYRVWIGGRKTWLTTVGVFGEIATDLYVYNSNGASVSYEFGDGAEASLRALWPLKVGNAASYRVLEEGAGFGGEQTWTVALKVVKTEMVEVKNFSYATYLVEAQARSTHGMSFTRQMWYEPGSGLIIKSVKRWTGKRAAGSKTSYLDVDDEEAYGLVGVEYPGGTTLALKGTEAGGVDPSLLAELEKLKQTVEEVKSSSQVAGDGAPVEVADIQFGSYHALVIGIDNYKYLPQLKTAVRDATAIAKVLADDYSFRVRLLVNPTRLDIIDALDEFRETLTSNDNLLIYYAGHGVLDEDADRGYWLPIDAKTNRRARWVSNATITDSLKTLQAKHVMVVADSCYSGTLTRSANIGLRSGDYFRRMAKKWTRVALVSGGLEPVADKGSDGHSPFAKAFIDALKGNEEVLDGTQLFNDIRRPVMLSAQQTPEYSDVRNAGHEGGDFLFVRKK